MSILKGNRIPLGPLLLLLPVIVCGIGGQVLCPHDPNGMDISSSLKPPAWMAEGDWTHLLGTDHLGRDMLSRLIIGARTSLAVGLFGVGLAGLIGICLGMVAGYSEGKLDHLVMRIVDIQMSVPAILLTILLAAVLGSGLNTIIISITVVFWTGYARVIRAETLDIKQREFVIAARVIGSGSIRILIKHILPNLVATIIVLATLQLGRAIIIEASLTFLGLGLQPPASAWGLIVSEGRNYLSTAWWVPTFAGLAIMMTVLGTNLMGDWLRDKLDPRLRQL